MSCDEIASHVSLRSVFGVADLSHLQPRVPEVGSESERADWLIHYLPKQTLSDGRSAWIVFLEALLARYEPADSRYHNLDGIIEELHQQQACPVTLPPNSPTNPQLEHKIRDSNTMLDIHGWLTRLAVIKHQVCRITVSSTDKVGFGTGFLLAPDTVLTNYHVVERVICGQTPPTAVSLLFDYHLEEDGVTPHVGKSYRLPTQDWLMDESPYSQLDLTMPGDAVPAPDQLDYALLRVDGRPGDDLVARIDGAGQRARGFIQLAATAHTFAPNSPLLIVQHPDGKELKLAIDTDAVLGLNGNATRVRYRTNTEPGSSGSPCFDANWNLVALHHSGDPNYATLHRAEYNQGIPIVAILNLLQARGKLGLVGA